MLSRVTETLPSHRRAAQARWRVHTTSRDRSTPRRSCCQLSAINSSLAGLVGDASTIEARGPKELREGKPGDQRAATNTGCEEDQFFGDDLHSNACRDGDEAGGPLPLVRGCAICIGTGPRHD